MTHKLNEQDLSNRAEIVRLVVSEAAKNVLKYTSSNKIITSKEGKLNYATEADIESNNTILRLIKKSFPQDSILSEETLSNFSDPLTQENLWVVDPLDGTNNFKHGRKQSAVSVGFVKNGEPVIGAVYDIFNKGFYFAEKGNGAYLNGRRINVSDTSNLEKMVMATDTGSDEEIARQNLKALTNLPKIPWVIITGSAVLSFCEVAQGSIDLYSHRGVYPWDVTAAIILIREAGGVFWTLDGKEGTIMTKRFVTANKNLALEFLKHLN